MWHCFESSGRPTYVKGLIFCCCPLIFYRTSNLPAASPAKSISEFGSQIKHEKLTQTFHPSIPNITRDEKVRFFSRLSAPLAFESPSFWNTATCMKSKETFEAPMIGLPPVQIRCSSAHPSLRTIDCLVSSWKRTGKICRIINKSSTQCPILLKFVTLVHYGHDEPVLWLKFRGLRRPQRAVAPIFVTRRAAAADNSWAHRPGIGHWRVASYKPQVLLRWPCNVVCQTH